MDHNTDICFWQAKRDRKKEDSFGFPEAGTDIKISKELAS